MSFFSKLFNKSTGKRFRLNKETSECVNIVDSIAKAKVLHRELILLCHPDRHINQLQLANELTSLVNTNKHNFQELKSLEKRIKSELY